MPDPKNNRPTDAPTPIAYQAIASLDDSLRIVRKLTPIFDELGYLCGLYGSTLALGCGDDVDLLIVSVAPRVPPMLVIETLKQRHGFTPIDIHCGPSAVGCVGVYNGVLVDLRIFDPNGK